MESCTPGRCEFRRYVSECECDFTLRLTMGGLLRMVQEISTLHCTLLGVTGERYRETHTAFLLAKLCAQVYEDIPAGSEVLLTTRPASPTRAIYPRYTAITMGDKLAAAVYAQWVLVDTDTRRILRKTPEALGLPFSGDPVPELPIRIPKADGTEVLLGEETARYSRCDQNRHMNNTRYADIICDYLPPERFQSGPVRELAVSYHRELPMGGTLRLYSREEGPGRYYFQGRGEEQVCFEAGVRF